MGISVRLPGVCDGPNALYNCVRCKKETYEIEANGLCGECFGYALDTPGRRHRKKWAERNEIIEAFHFKVRARARGAARRTSKINARPNWADEVAIERVYYEAKKLSDSLGIEYQVDHIIPLQHRDICGLDIAENLRAIPAKQNLSKNNGLDVDAEERRLLRHARKYGM